MRKRRAIFGTVAIAAILALVFWWSLPRIDPRLVGTWTWRSDDATWEEVSRLDADGRAALWIVKPPGGLATAESHYRWTSDGNELKFMYDANAMSHRSLLRRANSTVTDLWRTLRGHQNPFDGEFNIRLVTNDMLELELIPASPDFKSHRMIWRRIDAPSSIPPTETRR